MRANLPSDAGKPVVLLVAEAVTLAHFARVVTLARSLDAERYTVVVASDPRYARLEPGLALQPLDSIPTACFEQALAAGRPVYDEATLARYVEDDLDLLDRVRPALVVGDFRLSLAVSAPVRHVPYAAVVNAYWSPYAEIRFPVPDMPLTRALGTRLAQPLFDLVRPLAFKAHARPLNRVRRRFGLRAIPGDVRHAYSWGDATLYADLPEFVPVRGQPAHHHFLGPVLWSTGGERPDWWDRLPSDRPLVFVSLGSSGRADFIGPVLDALARMPVTVVVATAGKTAIDRPSDNLFVAPYVPVDAISARAQLVVCNGGSLTTYWALKYGAPVLGICTNLDQMLNMAAIERHGAGLALRADGLMSENLASAARRLLSDGAPEIAAARRLAIRLGETDCRAGFARAVAGLLA